MAVRAEPVKVKNRGWLLIPLQQIPYQILGYPKLLRKQTLKIKTSSDLNLYPG